ncbi:spore germination protein (amino acid permease) [Pullulanibacillus pueri]|uniref:Germination protein GerB n=1 Tax=Pullulanibacillus pueri TaxID=1437324 RepID=A0A8J2ZRX0_9BACL|nr:GerAB/ArcD/ProY family transporter [Pullulanibacillus pueri]MBM7680011.1 spore germination protein (amino acid permease) [Pullulanibacillus pueri]GGH73929.1 germination protein GerB [Pullulanibacillus pueri]
MPLKIPENHQVSSSALFFILYQIQVGIGILAYQRTVGLHAEADGWISILFCGLAVQIVLWMMLQLLDHFQGDLITIHTSLFGKWLGTGLTIMYIFYYLGMALTVLNSYVSIVQVWMFPQMSYWEIAVLLLIVGYSFISGGLRSISGICLLSTIYSSPLFITLIFPVETSGDFDNMLPLFSHTPEDMFFSLKEMALNFEGISIIFMVYPFIKKSKKVASWAQYSVFLSTFLYTVLYIISVCYFNTDELDHILWPTMSLWKIVNLPFMERFEYIGITIWLFVILPNLCLTIWGGSRAIKRMFSINQRKLVLVILALLLICGSFFNNQLLLEKWNELQSLFGLGVLFGYIPFLYFYHLIVKKVRKHHAKA